MGTCSPYFEAGKKSLVVKRRNKTCLVTCHFNENTNLSQVSIPHAPPLPPGSQVGGGGAVGKKTLKNYLCSFRGRVDLVTNVSEKVS